MAAVLKTAVAMSHRGFESLSLRQSNFEYEMASFDLSLSVFEPMAIAEDSPNRIGVSGRIPEPSGNGGGRELCNRSGRPRRVGAADRRLRGFDPGQWSGPAHGRALLGRPAPRAPRLLRARRRAAEGADQAGP